MKQHIISLVILSFFLLFVVAFAAAVRADTYNTYTYTCDIGGDGECTWVMNDTTEAEEECPVLWNIYDHTSGTFLIHNVQMKVNSMTLNLNTVILQYDDLTGQFEILMVE